MKTLFLSPLQPQNAGGWGRQPWGACWMIAEGGEGGGWGGGGRGGIPASFPSRSPPPKQPFQPTPTPSPGSHQEVCEKSSQALAWAKPPLRPGPQALGPGSRHSHRLTSCSRVSNFLLRLKPMGPGLKTLGCYHNPQSADLERRWMVSEGGALQCHERRGSRLRSSISAAGTD